MGGCAPIPGGQASAESGSQVPTGRWETRWGALAQDAGRRTSQVLAIVAEARKSKREAKSLALSECRRMGGQECEITLEYHNVAPAGPVIGYVRLMNLKTVAYRSPNERDAKAESLRPVRPKVKGAVVPLSTLRVDLHMLPIRSRIQADLPRRYLVRGDSRCLCKESCLMRIIHLLAPLVFMIATSAFEAHAEGGVLRAVPHRRPGVGGCAPIPGGEGAATSEPRATGKWIKTWGVFRWRLRAPWHLNRASTEDGGC